MIGRVFALLMGYCGSKVYVKTFWEKAEFVEITSAGFNKRVHWSHRIVPNLPKKKFSQILFNSLTDSNSFHSPFGGKFGGNSWHFGGLSLSNFTAIGPFGYGRYS